jgi:hypothetical protein
MQNPEPVPEIIMEIDEKMTEFREELKRLPLPDEVLQEILHKFELLKVRFTFLWSRICEWEKEMARRRGLE